MNISNPNLKFNGKFTVRKKTERIIIHHSATPGDVPASTIHQWHLGNGWLGIGYHYVVRTFGLIEIGRPEWAIGSHSGAAGNSNGIGICVAGNFMNARPTDKQIQALVELIRDIYSRHGVLPIIGHRDVMATACPGAMFPMDELRNALAGNPISSPPVNIQVAGQRIQGMLIEGKTMAPIRQTLDALRIPFAWDAGTNSAVIGFYRLPAVIINGTGYLPIRELAAAIDRGVGWDANTRTATII
jgi:hypothetical protein